MKIKKAMLLLVMVLTYFRYILGCDETPVCSFILKSEAIEGNNCVGIETGKVAGSIEADAKKNTPEMEGNFTKKHEHTTTAIEEEEPDIQASEPAEQTNMDLCVGLAKEIYEQTNAEREAAGLKPLIWDNDLAKYANIRAQEIITNFSHVRDDGTRCTALSNLIIGENLARGPHANGEEFLAHWMASEGHKTNILYPKYTRIGVGTACTKQGDTAVQLFGIN